MKQLLIKNGDVISAGDIAFWSERDPVSIIIQWVTKGKFNHCEVVTSPTTSIGAKWDGVKQHDFADVPGTITVYHLDGYDAGKLTEGLDFAAQQIGDSYDFIDFVLNGWAIIRPQGPFPRTPQKYTCSELVSMYLQTIQHPAFIGYTEADAQVTSPNDIARLLLL